MDFLRHQKMSGCVRTTFLAALFLLSETPGIAACVAHTRTGTAQVWAAQYAEASASFADIISLVRRRGWAANLGAFCNAVGLTLEASDCVVQQVAYFVKEGTGRGFNLIPLKPGAISFVLLFKLELGFGEFYLATPAGNLISASILKDQLGYSSISIDEARNHFESEVKFFFAFQNLSFQFFHLCYIMKDRKKIFFALHFKYVGRNNTVNFFSFFGKTLNIFIF